MSTPILKLEDIDLNDLSDTLSDTEPVIRTEVLRPMSRAVAIIGMDGRIGEAEDLEAFWEFLVNEREGLRALPEQRRRDLDDYLTARGVTLPIPESLYFKETFLTDIAGFDHSFFGISQQEAKYMDPNQRIFLETAWKALEDSGYGGKEIQGTDTGIFVGFSSDFGEAYRYMLNHLAPDASEIAVAGNIKSIIASRLSYHLNLKGPALLVDTACSSGLVATYLACRSIRAGECSMAVAGAVKCDLVPLDEDRESGVGTKDIKDIGSADGHTRTFDDASDGTAAAEGSFAFVLKPLEAAIRDGDTIRAVILGGAVNQDGASNGITAPNSEAQEDLIVRALTDAGVSAESISYIEAHGTATRLGDPIEISGIQRAFRHFTNKKQFCAVGSLKTNVGHLDNAAGLGGLAKLVLSMQHKVIPASLNFSVPNRNIPFIQSPVYVNNKTVSWPGGPDEVIRSGINSFGLSGTNCHLVLESAPVMPERLQSKEPGCLLLLLSAKNNESLRLLAAAYNKRLADTGVDLADAVMTASRGRLHHNFRLAIVFENRNELCTALQRFADMGSGALPDKCLYYGEHRLIVNEQNKRRSTDISETDREHMNNKVLSMMAAGSERPSAEILAKWAELYVAGAELPWNYLTLNLEARRIPLPTYPFQRIRCWAEPLKKKIAATTHKSHPLLGESVLRTIGHTLMRSSLRPEDNWELSEHRINGTSLLPGTALVEMMVDCAYKLNQNSMPLCFKDIIFEQPVIVDDGSSIDLHLLVEDESERKHLRFASISPDGEWVQHSEGLWQDQAGVHSDINTEVDLKAIGKRLERSITMDSSDDLSNGLQLSERWNNSFISCLTDEKTEEFLIELALPSYYSTEQDSYHLHPALMDAAVNAANTMMGEGELYLPLSYGELVVYRHLPAHFFAHLRKTGGVKGDPIHRFDIGLYDTDGKLVVGIRNYCIKSASKAFSGNKAAGDYGYRQVFNPYKLPENKHLPSGTVVLAGKCPTYKNLSQTLKDRGHRVVEIIPDSFDWGQALKPLAGEPLSLVVFAWEPPQSLNDNPKVWEYEANEAVYQGFEFLKAWSAAKLKTQAGLFALTQKAWAVEENPIGLHPGQAALGGLWRVGALEFETLNLRCIDCDEKVTADTLINEFAGSDRPYLLAYRDGQAYEAAMTACALPAYESDTRAEAGGMFVLSGGTGELGIEVAGLLARRGVRRLALLGSSPVPPGNSWEDLAETSGDEKQRKRLRKWLELKKSLEALEVRSVRIDDYKAVAALISELRDSYGPIQGVIHLAGRAGDGFIFQKTGEVFSKVYAPKANGAWNLHLATLEDEPEVFIEFSSISSLLLNAGQSDYTAANMFLDTLAEYRRQTGLPTISLQWPAWRETGIARRMGAVDESELYIPLNTDEALGLLDRVLWKCKELPPVLMPGRVRRKADDIKKARVSDGISQSKGKQVTLLGLNQPDNIDMAVAGIWARTLEVDKLEVDDEFSSLGGNSLLTSQMLREYEKLYPGAMEIADLFTYTTILKQSEYLKAQLGLTKPEEASSSDSEDDLDKILELVAKGEMTVEESSSRISINKRRDK